MTDKRPPVATKRRILWLHMDRWACGWYRCFLPALSLEDTGRYENFFIEHTQITDAATGKLKLEELNGIDLVVIQRAHQPVLYDFMMECKRRSIRVVFETDDDLFRVARHNPSFGVWGPNSVRKLTRALVQGADHCLVSTPPLRAAFADQCDVSLDHITVAYNHVHPILWGDDLMQEVTPTDNEGKTILGWQGSATHDLDFAVAIPALKRILADFPQVMLRFFGSVPKSIRYAIDPCRFEWMKGVPFDQYPRNLKFAHFDISLAPLATTKFNASKSAIRYLEASVLQVPTVATRIDAYSRVIRPGLGLLASTEQEWYTHLAALIDSPELRQTIGAAAREYVLREWGPESRATAWIHTFDHLLEG